LWLLVQLRLSWVLLLGLSNGLLRNLLLLRLLRDLLLRLERNLLLGLLCLLWNLLWELLLLGHLLWNLLGWLWGARTELLRLDARVLLWLLAHRLVTLQTARGSEATDAPTNLVLSEGDRCLQSTPKGGVW
jgi:hypothetical protein